MIALVLSDRNVDALQFSHKITCGRIVFPENLSVRQSPRFRRTVPVITGLTVSFPAYLQRRERLAARNLIALTQDLALLGGIFEHINTLAITNWHDIRLQSFWSHKWGLGPGVAHRAAQVDDRHGVEVTAIVLGDSKKIIRRDPVIRRLQAILQIDQAELDS